MVIEENRLQQLLPDVASFFQLLDALHTDGLAETPPSNTFQARWMER
jgi:hypothetical protein